MRRSKIQLQALKAAQPKYASGIGLLEVLLFLFIVGATLAVGYAWLMTTQQSRRAEDRTAILQQANRYIEAFTAANNRLPCPAADLNGVEDCAGNRAKGYLPYRTINFDASQLQRGVGQLRYLVAASLTRQDVPLPSVNPLNTFEPAKWDDTPATPSRYDFKQVSTADYCRNLSLIPANEATVITRAGNQRTVAYALASAGLFDADADGNLFDGHNAALNNATMEAPENTSISGIYDDKVLVRTAEDLSFNADCPTLMLSLNTMALGVAVVDAAADAKVVSASMMAVQAALALGQSAATVGAIVLAGVSLSTAIADTATATAALTAAIAACVVIVGCVEIPHATASVVATSAAVVASTVALAAIAVAFIPQVAYTVAVAAASVAFGISTAQTVDLSKARAAALDGYNKARSNRIITAAALTQANSNATGATNAKNAAYNALLQGARDTVAATNAAGNPNGTTPITAMDVDVANVASAAADVVAAEYQVSVARGALDAAQDEVNNLQLALANTSLTTTITGGPGYSTHLTDVQNLLNQTGSPAARRAQIQIRLDQKIIERDARAADLNNATMNVSAAKIAYEGTSPTGGASGVLIANSKREYCMASTCGFYYNNQFNMLVLLNDFKNAYDRYAAKAKIVAKAQEADNAAATAEADALTALNNINALSEGTPLPGQALITLWAGAEAILQAADAKGGAK